MKFYYVISWRDEAGAQRVVLDERSEALELHRLLKKQAEPHNNWCIRVFTENAWEHLANGKAIVFSCVKGRRKGSYQILMWKGC